MLDYEGFQVFHFQPDEVIQSAARELQATASTVAAMHQGSTHSEEESDEEVYGHRGKTKQARGYRALNTTVYAHVRNQRNNTTLVDSRRRPVRNRTQFWRQENTENAYGARHNQPRDSRLFANAPETKQCYRLPRNEGVEENPERAASPKKPTNSSPRLTTNTAWQKAHADARYTCQSWLAAACALLVAVTRVYTESQGLKASRFTTQDTFLCDFGGGVQQSERCSDKLSVEIFAAPKPFLGSDATQQERAIESWLSLKPQPIVTLLGNASGYRDAVIKYRLDWIPHIDSTFLGVPLFNAIVSAANESTADIVILANSDIILFDDILYALRRIYRDYREPWMAVGARWDINDLPSTTQTPSIRDFASSVDHKSSLLRRVRDNGTLHTYGGIDVWAWNTRAGAALFDGLIPHFVFGRGKYDNWFTHEVIKAGYRKVIDVSEACTLVHVSHDHHIVSNIDRSSEEADYPNSKMTGANTRLQDKDLSQQEYFWNRGKRSKFELYINTFLAAAHGSYVNQMGTVLHAPWKLQSCYEPDGLCMLRRRRPSICRCEHSPFVPRAQNDPFTVNDSRVIFCGLLSLETQQILSMKDSDTLERFVISGKVQHFGKLPLSMPLRRSSYVTEDEAGKSNELHGALLEAANIQGQVVAKSSTTHAVFGLPLVLDRILEVIEQRTGSRTVVVTMLNSNHKKLLMRFACAARRVGIFEQMVVAALNDDVYHYAITKGIAVYLEDTVYRSPNEESVAARAGSASHSMDVLLSLRARIVSRLLKLGREVLYSDPDVIFLANPFRYLELHLDDDIDLALLRRGRMLKDGMSTVEMPHAESLSTALFFARTTLPSELALAAVSVSAERGKCRRAYEILCDKTRPIGDILQDARENLACRTSSSGAKIAALPAEAFADRQVISQDLQSKEDSRLVAVHIALTGYAEDKLAAMQRAPGLDLYDEQMEVCKIDALLPEELIL